MGILTKKDRFTLFTPIPGFVPRQLAITLLHDHAEVMDTNPLVIAHWPTPCPSHARVDEQFATWYEITQRVQYIPGIGSKGAGTIRFSGCFQDQPWGLQTHIYAPMGVDLRNVYRIAGYQPGTAKMPGDVSAAADAASAASVVSGISENAPTEGLYLRTDVEVESSIGFSRFVRSQTKDALRTMVSRMVKRVEELDARALQEMLDNDKLVDPNIPPDHADATPHPRHGSLASSTTESATTLTSQASHDPRLSAHSAHAAQPSPGSQDPRLSAHVAQQPSPLFSGQQAQFTPQSAQFNPHTGQQLTPQSAQFNPQTGQQLTPQSGHFSPQLAQQQLTPQSGHFNPQQAQYNPQQQVPYSPHPQYFNPQSMQFQPQPGQLGPHPAQYGGPQQAPYHPQQVPYSPHNAPPQYFSPQSMQFYQQSGQLSPHPAAAPYGPPPPATQATTPASPPQGGAPFNNPHSSPQPSAAVPAAAPQPQQQQQVFELSASEKY